MFFYNNKIDHLCEPKRDMDIAKKTNNIVHEVK